jgi:hypothetical protein
MDIDSIKDFAIQILKKDKSHAHIGLFETEDKKIINVLFIFKNDNEKEEMIKGIRNFVSEKGVTEYILINECWFIIPKNKSDFDIRPSKNLNRKEMLIISKYTKDSLNDETYLIEFERVKDEIVIKHEEKTSSRNDLKSTWNFFYEYEGTKEAIEKDMEKAKGKLK